MPSFRVLIRTGVIVLATLAIASRIPQVRGLVGLAPPA
jgi:hypothetical protein